MYIVGRVEERRGRTCCGVRERAGEFEARNTLALMGKNAGTGPRIDECADTRALCLRATSSVTKTKKLERKSNIERKKAKRGGGGKEGGKGEGKEGGRGE